MYQKPISNLSLTSRERFLRVCQKNSVDRPPVWIMRQAGRTLPEYRKLREKYSFWQLCKTPELAAEVTCQPIRRFDIDAAIIFSDILVIPEAAGMKIQFTPRLTVEPSITSNHCIENLNWQDVSERLSYVPQAIKQCLNILHKPVALLGFSGAPYTLACYMIDGGASKTFDITKTMMYSKPELFHTLIDKLTDSVIAYLSMQIEAGVDAVQIFDTWASNLSDLDYGKFVTPYVKKIVSFCQKRLIPIIYYVNGISHLLHSVAQITPDVIGLDWRISFSNARQILGDCQTLQGNLDPSILLAPETTITEAVFRLMDESGGKYHIVNLGHGILPQTPIKHVTCFVKAVQKWAELNYER
ncbi:uroporphyrinogen decarboxylase [bacterium]|nr:uroporphyrinogen decarboxylase [candidate division CSSED10-310 bacterium]